MYSKNNSLNLINPNRVITVEIKKNKTIVSRIIAYGFALLIALVAACTPPPPSTTYDNQHETTSCSERCDQQYFSCNKNCVGDYRAKQRAGISEPGNDCWDQCKTKKEDCLNQCNGG